MHLLILKKVTFTIVNFAWILIFIACIGNRLNAKNISPTNNEVNMVEVQIPSELNNLFEIELLGAFRVYTKEGESSSNYAVGTLAFNPQNDSLFLAGHDHQNAIAEFKIPKKLGNHKKIQKLPNAEVIQPYVKVLDKKQVGNSTNRITGLLYYKGSLLVNSEIWYDGLGKNNDNHIVVENADKLRSSAFVGMLKLQGAAMAAGYMSYIPDHLHEKFGGKYLTGWASNYSITSRYSQGPSLYVFDPEDSLRASIASRTVKTKPKMVFPLKDGQSMVKDSHKHLDVISPIWGPMANARYGFIIPNSKWFLVVGYHGGIHGGMGYKITQDNGRKCGGGCTRIANDVYNYFWLFNIDTILNAAHPYMIQPYSFGKWNHPYDKNGKHKVVGAAFDHDTNRLFISLKGAGKVGKYDRPPLILVYKVKNKN